MPFHGMWATSAYLDVGGKAPTVGALGDAGAIAECRTSAAPARYFPNALFLDVFSALFAKGASCSILKNKAASGFNIVHIGRGFGQIEHVWIFVFLLLLIGSEELTAQSQDFRSFSPIII